MMSVSLYRSQGATHRRVLTSLFFDLQRCSGTSQSYTSSSSSSADSFRNRFHKVNTDESFAFQARFRSSAARLTDSSDESSTKNVIDAEVVTGVTKAKKKKPFVYDLGLPMLVPEWRKMFTAETLFTDISAGLTVGCIAVPLSLAIAVASGVPAEVGLVTAAVSGIAGGLMGGTTLAVTGPAAAISLLVVGAVQQHGLEALPVITMACGALQLASGVTRLGVVTKLVPVSVIAGFTTGVGTLILTGQIPKALGMATPAGLNPLEVLGYVGENLSAINPSSAALAIGTSAAMFMLPKVHTKLPSALLAVGGATLATHGLGLDVSLIGAIPSGLEAFKFGLPMLPAVDSLPSLAATTLMIYSMTSVESLLSCAALEKMKKTSYKHSPDQELVGQGLANMGSALFMGMPVTSVIARSGLNVKLNASTRLPALVQAGFVFGSVVFFSDSIAMIPMPALSGMLITTGCSMLNPAEFKHCYGVQKIDTVPFVATIGGMVSLGLAEGIGIGCATALALNYQNWNPAAGQTSSSIMKALEAPTVFHKMVQGPDKHNHEHAHTIGIFNSSHGNWNAPEYTSSRMVQSHEAHMYHTTAPVSTFQDETGERLQMNLSRTAVWQLNGPINFISMFEIDNMIHNMQDRLATDDTSVNSVVVDMHRVTNLEFTGIEELVTRLVEVGDAHETAIQMVNCSEVVHKALDQCDPSRQIERYSALKAAI
jgi:MFS superfamily sulfate permease-like transporter